MINRLTLVTEITVDEITNIYDYKNSRNKLVHRKVWRPSSSNNAYKKDLATKRLDLAKNRHAEIKMNEELQDSIKKCI